MSLPGTARKTPPGTEILDHADLRVLLARDVVGEFFDRRVQQFDGEHEKERADLGDIPAHDRRGEEAERQHRGAFCCGALRSRMALNVIHGAAKVWSLSDQQRTNCAVGLDRLRRFDP